IAARLASLGTCWPSTRRGIFRARGQELGRKERCSTAERPSAWPSWLLSGVIPEHWPRRVLGLYRRLTSALRLRGGRFMEGDQTADLGGIPSRRSRHEESDSVRYRCPDDSERCSGEGEAPHRRDAHESG